MRSALPPQTQDYRRSLARCAASRTRTDRPRTFTLGGRDWDLLDQVFAPVDSPSTRMSLKFLGLAEGAEAPRPHGTFLEVGCGSGVIAVTAALAGCAVAAVDISPAAVRNTLLNTARYRQRDSVRVFHSDLFTALPAAQRFSTVFWSSNYVLAPADFSYRHVAERAYVDPGYAAHRRYLAEAPLRTTAGGRALLHFSSRGDLAALREIAEECGRELTVRHSEPVVEGEELVEHLLLEIGVRNADRSA